MEETKKNMSNSDPEPDRSCPRCGHTFKKFNLKALLVHMAICGKLSDALIAKLREKPTPVKLEQKTDVGNINYTSENIHYLNVEQVPDLAKMVVKSIGLWLVFARPKALPVMFQSAQLTGPYGFVIEGLTEAMQKRWEMTTWEMGEELQKLAVADALHHLPQALKVRGTPVNDSLGPVSRKMIFKWLAGWTRTGDKKVLNRFTYLKPKHSGAEVEKVPPLSFYEEGRNLLLLKNALSFKPKQKKRFPWQERAGMLDVFWTPETKNKCKELWKRGEFFHQMFKEEKEKWELKKISLLLKPRATLQTGTSTVQIALGL